VTTAQIRADSIQFFRDHLEAAGLPINRLKSQGDLDTLIAEVFAVGDALDRTGT